MATAGFANPFATFWSAAMPNLAGTATAFSARPAMADPMSAMLSFQFGLLQAAVQPLQAMSQAMGAAASHGSSKTSKDVDVTLPWMPAFNTETAADCAVASITLPDQTTFKITVPMSPAPVIQPFWPWAGPFGAGGHATPPTAIDSSTPASVPSPNCKSDGRPASDDVMGPDKALNESMRRTYMRSSRN